MPSCDLSEIQVSSSIHWELLMIKPMISPPSHPSLRASWSIRMVLVGSPPRQTVDRMASWNDLFLLKGQQHREKRCKHGQLGPQNLEMEDVKSHLSTFLGPATSSVKFHTTNPGSAFTKWISKAQAFLIAIHQKEDVHRTIVLLFGDDSPTIRSQWIPGRGIESPITAMWLLFLHAWLWNRGCLCQMSHD